MVFRFLVGRTAKFFGRNTNLLFFTTLYREMYKELVDITGSETKASHILKLIGVHGTFESGKRQISVLRMFPNDPVKVMEYIDVIWYVIFGTKLDEYELVKIPHQGTAYPDLIFHISKCPICGGYGSSPLDNIDCNKIQSYESFYASGLVGMLEETANFILELKKNEYRILMQETKCFCRGDEELELQCQIIHKNDFNKDIKYLDDVLSRPFLIEADLEVMDNILSKPLDTLKEQLISTIQDKLQMSTFEFMEYFRDYEEEVARILGFLLIHALNENGRVIENACKNITFSKLIGHMYKNSVEMAQLTIPFDVIEDYKKWGIDMMKDITPPDMLEVFSEIPASKLVQLFYEGMKKALFDLGVNFEGLQSNIWEELEIQKILEGTSRAKEHIPISEEEKKKQSQLKVQLMQELYVLLMQVMAIPSKMFLSTLHTTMKSTYKTGKESSIPLQDQVSKVLDLVNKLK